MICKPDSVCPIGMMTIHLDTLLPMRSSSQPETVGGNAPACAPVSYLALLQVGLAVPCLSPNKRCALTAPFHPYPACRAVCFLWRFPSSCLGWALPSTFVPEVRTFLTFPRGHPIIRKCAIRNLHANNKKNRDHLIKLSNKHFFH